MIMKIHTKHNLLFRMSLWEFPVDAAAIADTAAVAGR